MNKEKTYTIREILNMLQSQHFASWHENEFKDWITGESLDGKTYEEVEAVIFRDLEQLLM